MISKYRHLYVADADSDRPGLQKGLFATKNFKTGEVIFIVKGEYVNMAIKTKKDSQSYPNALGIKRNLWLNPKAGNPLKYLNHSCNPNAGIRGRVTITARKPIKKGTHITIDYSTTECDELWTLDNVCECGEKNCRKVISSIQSLPVRIYKKYLPFIPTAMQKEYERAVLTVHK